MKKRSVLIPMLISAAVFLTYSAVGNSIDAVTSASQKYKITGGTAYSDSAVIEWQSTSYSNGSVYFKYGTSAGNYSTTYKMPSVSRGSHTEVIKPLKPNTTYYFQFNQVYGSTNHVQTGSFTTPAVSPVSFTLTVKSGKGGGQFETGASAAITADDSSSVGKIFTFWGGAKGFIDDSTKSSAKITMPGKDLTVTANYKTVPVEYKLTVASGKGSGLFASGVVTSITADDSSSSGKSFTVWSGAKGFIDDSTKSSAKITMPGKDLTVKANYKSAAVLYKLTVKNGTGSGSFESGASAAVTADDSSASGRSFSYWSGAKGFIDDSAKSTASITMPGKDLTVTAVYKNATPAEYKLTVQGGKGGGQFGSGKTVVITADDSSSAGKKFVYWSGAKGIIDDSTKTPASITMPGKDVVITAVYKTTTGITKSFGAAQFAVTASSQKISLSLPGSGLYTVAVYDLSGRVLTEITRNFAAGTAEIPAELTPGVRMITVKGDGFSAAVKAVIR